MEQAPKYEGLLGTVLYHGFILLLLLLFRLSAGPNIPVEEIAEGVTVNFGTDLDGMGDQEPALQDAAYRPEPEAVVPTPPAKAKPVTAKVKETASKIITQDNESAPVIKKEPTEKELADKKALEDKKLKDKEDREIQRQADLENKRLTDLENQRIEAEKKKLEQQQSQVNAIKGRMGKSFGGAAVNGGTGGEGTGNTVGNQGDPTGSVDSKNRGPGGGRGAGISYNLDGRSVMGGLAKPEYSVNDYGDVVVTITVNKEGEVINAIPGAKGTTTTNSTLLEAARKAAMSAKFNKLTAPDAPVYQKGSITYKFKLQ